MLNLALTTPALSTGASSILPEYETLQEQAEFYLARFRAATCNADADAAWTNHVAFEALALDALASELEA